MTNILIRDLRENNLSEIAHIHLAAFPKSALGKLGENAVKRYYRWQLQGHPDAIALGIFQDHTLAGYCFAGLFRNALSGFLRTNRSFLIWRVITHPWLIATPLFRERLHLGWSIITRQTAKPVLSPVMPARSFGILAVAVDPQYQGLGLGRRLMVETEKIAKERGFLHLHLTVATDNSESITFYEKQGWQKSSAQDNVWRGFMVKDLGDGREK